MLSLAPTDALTAALVVKASSLGLSRRDGVSCVSFAVCRVQHHSLLQLSCMQNDLLVKE